MSRGDSERGPPPAPVRITQVETTLSARHVNFVFEPNLDIDQIRDVEGNQVRLSVHRAPKAMVARYAEQMKGGAIFPAIVVNDHYELVDGNTRWMAVRRNKRATIAAYVCSNLFGARGTVAVRRAQSVHGLSMTEEELHAFVIGAVEQGQVLDPKACSRMTGVDAQPCRWVAAKHFALRAVRSGSHSSDSTISPTASAPL